MILALAVLGSVVCFFSLVAIAFPRILLGATERIRITTGLRVVAGAIRLGFGIVVLLVADATRFPLALQVIGVFLLVSGMAVLVVRNDIMKAIVGWVVGRGPGLVRVGGLAGLVFGGFLLYAIA